MRAACLHLGAAQPSTNRLTRAERLSGPPLVDAMSRRMLVIPGFSASS